MRKNNPETCRAEPKQRGTPLLTGNHCQEAFWSYRELMAINERLDQLITQYPKIADGTSEEDDKWSLDVCGDVQELEERKAAFNQQGVFKDSKIPKIGRRTN